MSVIKQSVLLITALTALGCAYAATTMLNAKKSSITIVARQMNVPMSAKFNTLSGSVDYDPRAPENTKASVEIDIASFDLGDVDYNKEALKKDWFNSAQFPKASFVSSSMKAAADGTLTASGKLTIKGITVDVSFPVKISKDAGATTFDGILPIHRLAFHVGEGEWADTGMVADEVDIKFHVVTAP